MLETAEKEREVMRVEAEGAAVRVERLEREVDYLETQNPAPPCVEVDEALMEKQAATAKQRKNEKYSKLTGEGHHGSMGTWSRVLLPQAFTAHPCSALAMHRAMESQQGSSWVSLAQNPASLHLPGSPRLLQSPWGQGWDEGGLPCLWCARGLVDTTRMHSILSTCRGLGGDTQHRSCVSRQEPSLLRGWVASRLSQLPRSCRLQ